jgi:hypothetical protein
MGYLAGAMILAWWVTGIIQLALAVERRSALQAQVGFTQLGLGVALFLGLFR